MSDTTFIPHSGAGHVGPNAFGLNSGGVRLLLDCGATGRGQADWVEALEPVDAAFVTHAHRDHVGGLGRLLARFPRLAVWATPTTRRLAPLSLGGLPGVDAAQAEAIAASIRPSATRQWIPLPTGSDTAGAHEFRLMAFEAGHVPGAAMVLVEIDRGGDRPFRLLYTGDFCTHAQPLTPPALVPRTGAEFPIDVLVMEGILATVEAYADVDYSAEMARLVATLGGFAGPRLLGVDPIGQAGEVVTALGEAGVEAVIHQGLEAVLGASGVQLAPGVRVASEADCRRLLLAGRLVVAAGDQLGLATPAGRLVGAIVDRADALAAVVNRKYAKTVAGRLFAAVDADTPAPVDLGGRTVVPRLRLEHFLLPNHAPRWQLVSLVETIDPGRVLLVHGRRSGLYALKKAIARAGWQGPVDVPQNGESVVL